MHLSPYNNLMSTFAEGEFWIKKLTIPSGIDEGMYLFIFNDFKLHKKGSSTFDISRTKERT